MAMSRMIRSCVVLGLLAMATQLVLSRESGRTSVIGKEHLVSIEPLAEAGGELCEPEQGPPREAAKAARIAATEDRSKLKPLRWIHDPYAAYSSVAVDPINNEVVLTDENLFQI